MARKITGGLTGSSTLVGTVQISPDAILSTAADQNITISPGGTGNIVMSPAGAGQVTSTAHIQLNTQRGLRWADADSSHYVAFQSPATVTSNVTWTLPSTDGTASQALVTNGGGVLSFATAGAAISNNTTDSATNYLTFTTSTSGNLTAARVASTKLTFQPSTGTITATTFSGNHSGGTGSFTTLNASSTVGITATTTARQINPQTNNTYDLGTAALRWRNLYTQDLHLSNGIGDYTVVEGEENLYLVNNKTNKSFKFVLVEVDLTEVPPKSATN